MRKIQRFTGLAVLAAAMTAGPSAEAGFGSFGSYGSSGGASYGSSGGSSGGFVSYGSSGSHGSSGGYASSGGSSGVAHVGPVRRLIHRLHEHHAAKVARRAAFHSSGGSYGSSGGSSGGYVSYGSSGGSSGGSSYGSSGHVAAPVIYSGGSSGGSSGGGHYSSSSHSYHDVPVYSYNSAPSATQYAAAQATATVDNDTAILTVSVPESAIVRVNGLPTKSAGSIRQFMSSGLEAGYVYKYEIEVQYEGVEKPEVHTVKLRAGSAERVVFNAPSTASDVATESVEAPETVVTVHVPADAKVELAGNLTKGEGETRTFRTRRLAAGEAWDSYTIRVTANINGAAVTKEKTLRLEAGSAHDLAFEFDVTEVASR
jgi:uncharacterized protein (TIGR03000 family)